MSNYLIPDTHGMYDKLCKRLAEVGSDKSRDSLYFIGDICDRGEQNFELLEFFHSLDSSLKPVFGNHDIWLYDYFKNGKVDPNWERYNGGYETLVQVSKLSKEKKDIFAEFLGAFPYIRDYKNNILCHNFVKKEVIKSRIGDASPYDITLSNAIEKGLLSDYTYDSELFNRCIADFVTARGDEAKARFQFSQKEFDETFDPNKKYFMGHTPSLKGVYIYKNLTLFDTAAFVEKYFYNTTRDGWLTIINLDSGEVILNIVVK